MEEASLDVLDPATRRALYRRALVRPLLTVTALLGLYYLLPLDRWHDPLTVLAIVGGRWPWSDWEYCRSGQSCARATRGTGRRGAGRRSSPVLLLFAAGYCLMSYASPGAFTEPMDRTDAIYFTVTVFATVGFGDIAPVTTSARVVVTLQMVGDLLVLGVLLQAIVGAVKLGRARRRNAPAE